MKVSRIIATKLVRFGEGEAMDREFWLKVGAAGRFSAAWEMVAEVDLMRGGTGNVPRLRRDVARSVRLKDAKQMNHALHHCHSERSEESPSLVTEEFRR